MNAPIKTLPAADRVAVFDWKRVTDELDAEGAAILERLLTPAECRDMAGLYADDSKFRSHGLIGGLREALYTRLVPIANRWNERMRIDERYPANHQEFLALCYQAGQRRPTPLLLRYGPGDYNCLHQDVYGDLAFPIQVAILLSKPGEDFEGGEFVLTEQRPRMQTRVDVVPLRQGDAVAFAVHHRPVQGARGSYRVNLRHGVSRVRCGRRYTLGVIFHDAK